MKTRNTSEEFQRFSLTRIVLRDCVRNVFFIFLLAACVTEAFMIISQVQETRRTITEFSTEVSRQDALDQEYQHLRLEQQTLSELSRIADEAGKKMGMHQPDVVSEEVIVNLSETGKRRVR
ncbi:cell division protein FtsL [Succinimonas amylolytica]|uniref:cell division protein FtsL n=1 Tax=Succinimonas amylolytica TaxID=83769 RepID=UPI00037F2341|nr:cell division protein FtsL [Succinimonas amylolytica]